LDVEAIQVEVGDHPRLLRLRPRHRHRSPFAAGLKFPAASRDSALAFASVFPLSFFSFVFAVSARRDHSRPCGQLENGDLVASIAASNRARPVRNPPALPHASLLSSHPLLFRPAAATGPLPPQPATTFHVAPGKGRYSAPHFGWRNHNHFGRMFQSVSSICLLEYAPDCSRLQYVLLEIRDAKFWFSVGERCCSTSSEVQLCSGKLHSPLYSVLCKSVACILLQIWWWCCCC
jgi:hypothetical protein